jgi:cell shape-determining protein MreC
MKRADMLKKEFDKLVEEFGSPENTKTQRRKMLKQLKDMEQELDKYYKL